MRNFDEEARALAKDIVYSWQDYKDFDLIVEILKDYIVDQDSAYQDKLAKFNS